MDSKDRCNIDLSLREFWNAVWDKVIGDKKEMGQHVHGIHYVF